MVTAKSPRLPEAEAEPIYLLRHGAVDAPGGGRRYIGATDLALSDRGREQARCWAERFADIGLATIACSPLKRCRETAEIIGRRCGRAAVPVPALREIDLGTWEGRRMETIRTRHPRAWASRGAAIADFRPPRGESFRDLQQRAWPAFEDLSGRCRGAILMVTHAGVIRVLVCRLLAMPLHRLFRIGQDHAALTIVLRRPDGYRLQALNLDALPMD